VVQSEELKFQQAETAVLQRDKGEVEAQNKTLARELELQLLKEREYAALCTKRARDNKDLQAKVRVGCGLVTGGGVVVLCRALPCSVVLWWWVL
jgi:hypothetical protein